MNWEYAPQMLAFGGWIAILAYSLCRAAAMALLRGAQRRKPGWLDTIVGMAMERMAEKEEAEDADD